VYLPMTYNKPLPNPKGISETYWKGLKDKKLLIQVCNNCHEHIFYPRILCPKCGDEDIEFKEHSGEGEIYSYTVLYKSIVKGFSEETPYALALVKLDGGNAKMMTNIVGCSPDTVEIGMRVSVVFTDVTDEFTLPHFIPVGGQ
jgi:uncharacterized protein